MKMPTTKKHIIERIIEHTKNKHYRWELVEDSIEIRKYQVNPKDKFNHLSISLYKNKKEQRIESPKGWILKIESNYYTLPLVVEFEIDFFEESDLSLFTEIGNNLGKSDDLNQLYYKIHSIMDEAFMFV